MSVYLTSFNKKSYPQSGKEWYNVAFKQGATEAECDANNNRVFEFNTYPVFSKKGGIMLGANRLYGPLSNNLGISLQSTFTIFMTCRHGDFIENPKEIELLKLYANSNNNNGIVLFIKAKTVDIKNNIQSGQLMFRFIDSDKIIPCRMNAEDTTFIFDKLNMSMFFVVKEVDKIRILYMIGGSLTIYELARINIPETIATFSNKEMVINRFQNWKGSMFHFGVIPEAVSDNKITDIYSHCYGEYLKVTNTDFLKLMNDYNSMLNYLKRFTKCPYNDTVCKTCSTVTKWTDINQVLSSPPECRMAIDTFCKANTKHAMCKCWDTSNIDYNSASCRMYRKIFSGTNLLDELSQDELNYIKNKFKLINPDDCPKPVIPKTSCLNEALIKNTYTEYDFNKIRINPDSLPDSKKVGSPYMHEETEKKKDTKEPSMKDYVYKPISVTGEDEDGDSLKKVSSSGDLQVDNIYRTDPNIAYDQAHNVAFKDVKNVINTAKPPANGSSNTFLNKLMNMFLPSA